MAYDPRDVENANRSRFNNLTSKIHTLTADLEATAKKLAEVTEQWDAARKENEEMRTLADHATTWKDETYRMSLTQPCAHECRHADCCLAKAVEKYRGGAS